MANLKQEIHNYTKQYLADNSQIPDVAYDALEKKAGLSVTFQKISDLQNKNEHVFPIESLEKA